MNLGNSLFHARKRRGLSQEDVADEKINWTNEWGKKYPILLTYQGKVNIPNYAYRIKTMLDELEQEYKFNAQDAMLVFKDILYNVWKERSGSR